MKTTERQYLDLIQRTVDEGVWVDNPRTGTECLTVINADIDIDLRRADFPVPTTRKFNWKMAIAESLGYYKAFTNAGAFRALGAKTWDANANENEAWLKNANRIGPDHMGKVYGAVAADWPKHDGTSINLFRQVYEDLKAGKDNRGEIVTFWNPGEFELGCLRPCMHTHQFSLLGNDLYLNSFQRSQDILLGGAANIVQVAFFLQLMAHITGKRACKANLKIVNAHIYDNQYPVLMEKGQLDREPKLPPSLIISHEIKTWDDVVNIMTPDHVELLGYRHHDPIVYPFSV